MLQIRLELRVWDLGGDDDEKLYSSISIISSIE